MNYVKFIIRNLENVPGKSGVGQEKVREFFFSKSVGTLIIGKCEINSYRLSYHTV